MANGLVSRHAYTVTGAEQVRLPVDTVPQGSCSPKQESESQGEPSKAETGTDHSCLCFAQACHGQPHSLCWSKSSAVWNHRPSGTPTPQPEIYSP